MTLHLIIIYDSTIQNSVTNSVELLLTHYIIFRIRNGFGSVFDFWWKLFLFAIFVNAKRQICVRMIFWFFVWKENYFTSISNNIEQNEWMNECHNLLKMSSVKTTIQLKWRLFKQYNRPSGLNWYCIVVAYSLYSSFDICLNTLA